VTLWHTLGREISGAWRSVRYDVRNRRDTYAGNEWAHISRLPAEETSRRIVTASGVVLLIAGGAAGTYLAVAGGLGALLTDPADNATPQALPAPPAASAGTPRDRDIDPLADAPKTHRLLRRAAPSTVPAPETERPPALPPEPSTPAGGPTPESTPLPEPSPSTSESAEPVPSVSTSRIWGGESGARG
jgi:hypothetical protein